MIREAQQAWDSHEVGRLVHRFGGLPVGSFTQSQHRPLVPGMAHALLFDQTHDNPSPLEKRSVFDLLPAAALVSLASCGSGSNRGYDEIVPHHIHVVNENRTYAQFDEEVSAATGIIRARRALNELHYRLASEGFCEVYVDQMDFDVVAVTRHKPTTQEKYVLVAHTVFNKATNPDHPREVRPLHIEGKLNEVVLEARTIRKELKTFVKEENYLNGMDNITLQMEENLDIAKSKMARLTSTEGNQVHIALSHFPPGSIIVFKFSLTDEQVGKTLIISHHKSYYMTYDD